MKSSRCNKGAVLAALCGLALAQPAMAGGRGHHHGGWHGHHDYHGYHSRHPRRWSSSVIVGIPLYHHYDYWDRPRDRTIVVERERVIGSGPAPAQYWYYCDSYDAYYPYVDTCPEGWQEVPAEPADAR